ncbi:MAG: hypothetical protein L6R39_004271 [Caloplaca ligustica]|nr:MAG: hypothetical protein L6R39_004271 [Caloplaca ligustica]
MFNMWGRIYAVLAVWAMSMIALGSCGIFERYDCWCRNETNLGWMRHYQFSQDGVEPFVIEEFCMQATKSGHGSCLDRHTLQYEYCAERPSADRKNRTEFCYHNGGMQQPKHKDQIAGPWQWQATAWHDDDISYNKYQQSIPYMDPRFIFASRHATESLCTPICRDYRGWNLPLMKPWILRHGAVASRHQLLVVKDMPNQDDGGGEWPPDATLPDEDFQPSGAEPAVAYTHWNPNPIWTWTSEALLLTWPYDGGRDNWNAGFFDPSFPRPPYSNETRMNGEKERPRGHYTYSPPTPTPPPPPQSAGPDGWAAIDPSGSRVASATPPAQTARSSTLRV